MNEEDVSQAERLNIEIGTRLLIEIHGIEGRLRTKLIGMDVGNYLIVAVPSGPDGMSSKLVHNNMAVLRFVNEGGVFGFESTIIGTVSSPVRLLVLSYPHIIAQQSLRKAERYDCYVPCHVHMAGTEGEGTIVDFSLGGCRCIVPLHASGEKTRPPAIDTEIEIYFTIHGDESIHLKGLISNLTEYHSAARVGVRFVPDDEAMNEQIRTALLAISQE